MIRQQRDSEFLIRLQCRNRLYLRSVQASTLLLISLAGLSQTALADVVPASDQATGDETIEVDLSVSSPAAYTLGAGDKINILIFGAPEYSGEALVLSDGSLNLPIAGTVYVAGMTLQEASVAIAAKYSPYINRPSVTVSLKDLRPVRVGIAGEVNRPGSYNLSSEDKTEFPTLTEAIEQAGGITSTADLRQISLHRRQGTQNQVITINLWEMLQTGELNQDIIVQGGDTIFIPTATALDPEDALQLGNASFAPETVSIYVVGEVTAPGIINIPQNTPLNQALLAAGGFDQQRAKTSSVKLIRLNPNGTVSQRIIPINFEQGIDEDGNPTLQNRDVIVVGRSDLAQFNDASEQVLNPVAKIFSTILGLINIFD